MEFPSLNLNSPETAFRAIKNTAATALAIGDVCCFSTAAPDGVSVIEASTASLFMFAGIASQAIAAGDYGRIQVNGPCLAKVIQEAGTAIVLGDRLMGVNAARHLIRNGAGTAAITGINRYAYALETAATGTAVALRLVMLRAL